MEINNGKLITKFDTKLWQTFSYHVAITDLNCEIFKMYSICENEIMKFIIVFFSLHMLTMPNDDCFDNDADCTGLDDDVR